MVHQRPGCVMAESNLGGGDCCNDGVSLKPYLGRGTTDVTQSIGVSTCGSNRCTN